MKKHIFISLIAIITQLIYAEQPITRLGAINQARCNGTIVDGNLDLKRKCISTLCPFPFFCGKPSWVTNLVLDENYLTELPERGFYEFITLTTLSVKQNNIALIDCYAFDGLDLLLTLSLDNNQLPNLQKNILQKTPQLTYFSASGNRIKEIENGTFRYLSSLKSLNLAYNKLPIINNTILDDLSGLQILSVAHNLISFMDTNCFVNNPLLKTIDLSFNLLTDESGVTPDQFTSLSSLKLLILTGNPMINTPNALKQALPNVTIIF